MHFQRVELRHDLFGEQLERIQHLGQAQVTERKLPDEIVAAGLLHLLFDEFNDGRGRTGDSASLRDQFVKIGRAGP